VQALGIPTIPKTPKVVERKGTTYIIPASSPYYLDPSPLFKQYESPRPSKQKPKPPSSSFPPPSSNNPFDGMEVEECEFVPYILHATPKKPKQIVPDPKKTKSVHIQAAPKLRSTQVQTSESFEWNWNGQGTTTRGTQTGPDFGGIEQRMQDTLDQTTPIQPLKPSKRKKDNTSTTSSTKSPQKKQHKQKHALHLYSPPSSDSSDSETNQIQQTRTKQHKQLQNSILNFLHSDQPPTDSGSSFSGSNSDSP